MNGRASSGGKFVTKCSFELERTGNTSVRFNLLEINDVAYVQFSKFFTPEGCPIECWYPTKKQICLKLETFRTFISLLPRIDRTLQELAQPVRGTAPPPLIVPPLHATPLNAPPVLQRQLANTTSASASCSFGMMCVPSVYSGSLP